MRPSPKFLMNILEGYIYNKKTRPCATTRPKGTGKIPAVPPSLTARGSPSYSEQRVSLRDWRDSDAVITPGSRFELLAHIDLGVPPNSSGGNFSRVPLGESFSLSFLLSLLWQLPPAYFPPSLPFNGFYTFCLSVYWRSGKMIVTLLCRIGRRLSRGLFQSFRPKPALLFLQPAHQHQYHPDGTHHDDAHPKRVAADEAVCGRAQNGRRGAVCLLGECNLGGRRVSGCGRPRGTGWTWGAGRWFGRLSHGGRNGRSKSGRDDQLVARPDHLRAAHVIELFKSSIFTPYAIAMLHSD